MPNTLVQQNGHRLSPTRVLRQTKITRRHRGVVLQLEERIVQLLQSNEIIDSR
jgi:hypothetical protein